jgi:hypothetical protein
MPSPNSNFSGDLLSTTMQILEDELFDNILVKNAITALLKEHGAVSSVDGGIKIAVPIEYAENGSYKRYSGADPLNTTQNEVFSVFEYEPKQIAINVQAHGREIHQNMGRGQIRDLVKSRVKNAKSSFENNFNEDILSDGTATNQIVGLQTLIADNPATGNVGGVNRANYSFARNQFYRSTTDGGAAMSATTIVPHFDSMDLLLQTYRAKTKAIIADNDVYRFYEGSVHPLQRLNPQQGTLGKLGFRTYQYKDMEVVFEPTTAGMPSATAYWIDPEVLELRYYAGRNLVRLPKRDSWNQDASIEYLAWMGALTCKNFRRLGVNNND